MMCLLQYTELTALETLAFECLGSHIAEVKRGVLI